VNGQLTTDLFVWLVNGFNSLGHNTLRSAVKHSPREGIKAKTMQWLLFSRHFNIHFHTSLSYQHFSKPIKPNTDGVSVFFKLQLHRPMATYHDEGWQHDFLSLFDALFIPSFVCRPYLPHLTPCGIWLHTKLKTVLTLRLLMSYIYIYIYGAPILDVSRSHTTTQHSR